jgi:hypothetical protein
MTNTLLNEKMFWMCYEKKFNGCEDCRVPSFLMPNMHGPRNNAYKLY